jgi:NADH-quinone oxidoreductase subunit E|tara:strand:+ start:253 stop:849 length:597 start_codon:yes stop_codon:yes gene_type:complete
MVSSFKKIADEKLQPDSFEFNKENKKKALEVMKNYPKNYLESSIMPLLSLAQEQFGGWIPKKAMEHISQFLNVSEMKVLELATFYSMYNLSPIAENHIEICTTTPCMLRGAEKILEKCKKKLNLDVGEYNKNKKFSLVEVECLGACVNAPVVKIGNHYYEDLDEDSINVVLENLENGKKIIKGPQISRKGSEPYMKNK